MYVYLLFSSSFKMEDVKKNVSPKRMLFLMLIGLLDQICVT